MKQIILYKSLFLKHGQNLNNYISRKNINELHKVEQVLNSLNQLASINYNVTYLL